MLVVAVMNGKSASSRPRKNRLDSIVKLALVGQTHVMCSLRPGLFASRADEMKSFIRSHTFSEWDLLVVGKSLGAWNLITRVMNQLEVLPYRRASLLTIDPNKPKMFNWRRNCNDIVLQCDYPFQKAINFYVQSDDKRKRVGARVEVPSALSGGLNTCISDGGLYGSHTDIVKHPSVKYYLKSLVHDSEHFNWG